MEELNILPPQRLTAAHDLSAFTSGEPALDDWLRRRALANETSEATGASRTYVLAMKHRVVGYYTLAAGAVVHANAPGRIRRNMPDPVPAIVLGRLAVDRSAQGMGLGTALLRDAILRVVQAADIAGIKLILVHAISERAKAFYLAHGFLPSPIDPMTVMITIAEAARNLP